MNTLMMYNSLLPAIQTLANVIALPNSRAPIERTVPFSTRRCSAFQVLRNNSASRCLSPLSDRARCQAVAAGQGITSISRMAISKAGDG